MVADVNTQRKHNGTVCETTRQIKLDCNSYTDSVLKIMVYCIRIKANHQVIVTEKYITHTEIGSLVAMQFLPRPYIILSVKKKEKKKKHEYNRYILTLFNT